MIKNKLLISILLISYTANNAYSQVTMGSSTAPVEGALLQLKENNNLGVNSTRGLLLPRVALISKSSFDPVGTAEEAKTHTGLVIYNTTVGAPEPTSACDPTPSSWTITKGVKVWTGQEWQDLSTEDGDTTIPPEWISADVKFIKDHEGNVYPVKKFGDQGYWLLENLRTKTIPADRAKYTSEIGGSLLEITDYEKVREFKKAHYYYPSPPKEYKPYFGDEEYPPISDDTFFKQYPNVGLMYNYFLALNDEEPTITEDIQVGTTTRRYAKKDASGKYLSFVQGICPDGWHVPYNDEFTTLFDYIKTQFDAGNEETSGVDLDFQSQNNVSIPRLPLTNCLPLGTPETNRGASRIALKGGFAAMWVGANSPFKSKPEVIGNDTTGPKEYGVLAVFSTVHDWKLVGTTPQPASTTEEWIGNYWIRPLSTGVGTTDDWVSGRSYKTNMYPVRCKKNDNTDSGILDYEDVFTK